MSATLKPVLRTEPIDRATLSMIGASLGPIQAMILRLGDVDLRRGAGVIDDRTKCLWTRDGRRIELSLLPGGGFAGSISDESDVMMVDGV